MIISVADLRSAWAAGSESAKEAMCASIKAAGLTPRQAVEIDSESGYLEHDWTR